MLKDGARHLSGSCAGCPDMYWFAYAADPPAERHRRGLWAQQVDELASPEQELNGATSAQKESPCSPLGMSGCDPHLHQRLPYPPMQEHAGRTHLAEARGVVNWRMVPLADLHWYSWFSVAF